MPRDIVRFEYKEIPVELTKFGDEINEVLKSEFSPTPERDSPPTLRADQLQKDKFEQVINEVLTETDQQHSLMHFTGHNGMG